MKIKKWHLFAFVIILFVISFFAVNLKFDKFYRLNDINNDNRVLIEKYLDEEEQKYLVENQIPIKEFIHLIELENFDLHNYQYYNLLKESQRYTNKQDIVDMGNILSTRLNFLFDDPVSKATTLIDQSLEKDFINNNHFQFQYIHYYMMLKPLYDENDYSYIDDLDFYIEKLQNEKVKNLNETIEMLCTAYTKEGLKYLFEYERNENVSLVYNPYEYTTVVNEYNYIGQYIPKDLLLTQNLPRKNYSMYLRKDAYMALVDMYQDLIKEFDSFILLDSYKSYDSLMKDDKKAGYDEMQLGLSVCISQSGIAYNQFEETKMSQWLEKHAYEYGFILRYPKNKASITNHAHDAHIYRYVGKSLANSLYKNNLTLEEYKANPSKVSNEQ